MKRVCFGAAILCTIAASIIAQAPQETVRAIEPPAIGLPSEQDSAGVRKFAFLAYGDTRGQVDGNELQPEHTRVIDAMVATVKSEAAAGFPVRFVLQSGDAVTSGGDVAQWNLRFVGLIERLTREAGVPYFFAVGNHDIGGAPAGSSEWARLRNASAAMSRLWPSEGSPRRLDQSAAFSFGFGQYFFIALDSNISTDDTQRTWVRRQLEGLDRQRYPHVVAFFHHPPITSGAHGGPSVVEPQSVAMRTLYLPLFRHHHVRMIIAGHDHLLDHWVEYYSDDRDVFRMDQIVTGGGGAPTYVYRGEPDLTRYVAEAAPQRVRLEHLVKPGPDASDNPHHFLVFEIDGDHLWIQAVGTGSTPFLPYGRQRIELAD